MGKVEGKIWIGRKKLSWLSIIRQWTRIYVEELLRAAAECERGKAPRKEEARLYTYAKREYRYNKSRVGRLCASSAVVCAATPFSDKKNS